jgi:hypothetical protein
MDEFSQDKSFAGKQRVVDPPVIIRCKQWEDFRTQSSGANTVSFLSKSEDKTFEVYALKDGTIFIFSGQIPNHVALLATWLSKQLNIEERRVLEGILALG